ncbi:MAG: 50S ribosomal protein L23 [Candidatus Wallbacteria bacterium]|nr:50S ribosomal protein L23 [Candidatus Wallbacteria bacterium]MBI4867808.1 50S ribosomal protein L23 [Candidatus Wallbacteria bacterium]
MNREPQDIILAPVVSEKAYAENNLGKYRFRVLAGASKIEIKQAVEKLFKVKVVSVNTQKVRGKFKRLGRSSGMTSDWRKAIVTLAAGETIDFFEKV